MDVAKYVRIFDPNPDDDFVAKREAVITDLGAKIGEKTNVSDLMEIGSGVCEAFHEVPAIPDALQDLIESVIKVHSVSFVREGHGLEMGVCGALALTQIVASGAAAKEGWSNTDVLGITLWTALSFLPACDAAKLEDLRQEAIEASRERIKNAGLKTRARQPVPALGSFGDETVSKSAFSKAVSPTIRALRLNGAMDREEIDLLWWVLCGSSEIFNRRLESLPPATRAITSGMEIGKLLRALPTQSHRNLALRGLEEIGPFTLPGLLDALGEDRLVIASSFANETLVDKAPHVFPLLRAIRSGNTNGAGANLPRPLSDWVGRALLERAVLQYQIKENREV